MARRDRNGERKPRSKRVPARHFQLGYYLIVTDTEATEKCYFEGLKSNLPEEVKGKIELNVAETTTEKMINKCLEAISGDAQYRIPWIVFDRDRVKDFDAIICAAEVNGINVGWSNPCFEIWEFAYFSKIPTIVESKQCCSKFADLYKRKTGLEYNKADKDLYKHLQNAGEEMGAIRRMENRHNQYTKNGTTKPSDMVPCSTVYKLVKEIRQKVDSEFE